MHTNTLPNPFLFISPAETSPSFWRSARLDDENAQKTRIPTFEAREY
jgi:hypothetical protein